MSNIYRTSFTARSGDIDELGHVNNAVWVRWVQDIATAHWQAVAAPAHVAQFVWVVIRHEIDYRGNVGPGARVDAVTFIPGLPRGAKFDRRVDFHDSAGKLLVSVHSTWAMIDKASGRLARIRDDVAAPFLAHEPGG